MTVNKESVQNCSDQVVGTNFPDESVERRGHRKNAVTSCLLSVVPGGKDESNRLNFEAVAHATRQGGKIVFLHAYAKSKGVKVMSQDEKEIKLEAFKAENVTSFCEELEDDNWALRAFGVLLESSSLNHFSEGQYDDAWLYRKGLRNIVELYLDRQEQKLNEIKSRSVTTPEMAWIEFTIVSNNGSSTFLLASRMFLTRPITSLFILGFIGTSDLASALIGIVVMMCLLWLRAEGVFLNEPPAAVPAVAPGNLL